MSGTPGDVNYWQTIPNPSWPYWPQTDNSTWTYTYTDPRMDALETKVAALTAQVETLTALLAPRVRKPRPQAKAKKKARR